MFTQQYIQRQLVVGNRQVKRNRSSAVAWSSNNKYDYIIVGGGAAGCVLANKLTADGKKNVLLLEAGPDNKSAQIRVPAGIHKLLRSNLDWNLNTPKDSLLADREMYIARGKVLGGSSSTNATLYHRGTAEDYDNWGIDGWSSKEVLQYFKQAENNPEMGTGPYHGVGGQLHVENPRYHCKVHDLMFEASKNYGLEYNSDFNDWSKSQLGYGKFQVTQEKGTRADSYRQYLKPVLGRSNLTVQHSARATKVEFEKGAGDPKAVGVKYVQEGKTYSAEIESSGEVLLCGGAIHSPHLLQLSGIGPGSHLRDHGINVVSDLVGVGENMQDHPAVARTYRFIDGLGEISGTDQLFNKKGGYKKRAILKYLLFKRGPLTTTGCDYGAFVSSTGGKQADIQFRFPPGLALAADGVSAYTEMQKLQDLGKRPDSGFSIQVIAVRAKSKGRVSIQSGNPLTEPEINLGYLSNPADLETLKRGLAMAADLANTNPLKDLVAAENFPGPEVRTDSEVEEYIRSTVHSANAVVGTCKMGRPGDDSAVVNSDLTVRGVRGLRVVDSSVMPSIPGGQTGAPTVMIAEKAAAMLTATERVTSSRVMGSAALA